jgi:DnaJ like chaperone protein
MDKAPATILRSFAVRCAGPLLGALAGIPGGTAGILPGAILGGLLQQVILRRLVDRKIARYFISPGKVGFDEGVAGLGAYCALATLLVSLSVRAARPNPLFREKPDGESADRRAPPGNNRDGELISRRVIHSALEAFPGSFSALALMKTFCRTALSLTDRINPDLLAESLAARRIPAGDIERLGRELESLAQGETALREAASLRRILAPFGVRGENTGKDPGQDDPWLIMGLERGAAAGKIKSRFRKLAALYHPDMLQSLDAGHRQSSARRFTLIQEACRKLLNGAEV